MNSPPVFFRKGAMKFTFFLPLLMKCAIALAPHARVGSFKTKSSLVGDMWSPAQGLARRFKQCVHNANPEEYWFDQRIHTLGNVGFFGGLHAAMAPVSTKLIDVFAYDGIEVREVVRHFCHIFICCPCCFMLTCYRLWVGFK